MVVSTLISRATDALKSAGAAASESIQTVVNTGTDAKDTVVGLGSAAVDLGVSAKDAVADTADAVIGYASAVASIGVTAMKIVSVVGIAVSMIVAPVPTAIGITLIELLVVISASRLSKVEGDLAAKNIARENGRIIDKLAKYGTIPATALVETDTASLRLDTVAGTISGRVKTGIFSSRDIADMPEADLRAFAADADEETARLIAAYLKFRQATWTSD